MKMKWMMIGLVAVLTACGGESGQTDEEAAAGKEQAAVVEASRADAEAGQSRTTETVNADGSVTTETTLADGSVTTTTTSRTVKTTTLPNSGSVEMDMNTDLNVNMDAEVNVDSEVNVATEVNVGSDVDMDVDADVDMDVDMDMNADIDMDVESSGTADASVTISDYADFDPQNMVDTVRHGSLTSYSQRTVGDVFGEVFSHPEWTYFESEDGDDVVEFTGEALYGDEEGRTTIQFVLYEDATFGLSGIWVGRGDETIDEEYSMSDAEIDKTLNIIYGLQQ